MSSKLFQKTAKEMVVKNLSFNDKGKLFCHYMANFFPGELDQATIDHFKWNETDTVDMNTDPFNSMYWLPSLTYYNISEH